MEEFKVGDLVFLTKAYEDYLKEKNPKLSISIVNRIGKIEEIIDWNSEKGKTIKDAREKSGKWKDLIIEDNKYLISVYYHDVISKSNGKRGVIEPCVSMFLYHPKDNNKVFFEKIPQWICDELIKKCRSFEVKIVPVKNEPTAEDIDNQLREEDVAVGGALLRALSKKKGKS